MRTRWLAALMCPMILGCHEDTARSHKETTIALTPSSTEPSAENDASVPSQRPIPPSASAVVSSIAAAKESRAPQIVIKSSGTPPRRKLRYQVAVGAIEKVAMDLATRTEMLVGDRATPSIEAPLIHMDLTLELVEPVRESAHLYTFRVDSTSAGSVRGVPDDVTRRMRGQLVMLEGLWGAVESDTQGRTLRANVNVPSPMDPQLQQILTSLQQTMGQLSVPFPDEPVGAGAKWDVYATTSSAPVEMQQTATYVLENLNEQGGSLSMAVRQRAVPGRREHEQGSFESLEASGSGKATFHFNRIAPESESDLVTTLVTRAATGGETQRVSLRIRIHTSIRTSPP